MALGHTVGIVDFGHRFEAVAYPTGSLLHRQAGRSVHHNLHRLASPAPSHDFRTSILLGGNHPQNQFRNFSSRSGQRPQTEPAGDDQPFGRLSSLDTSVRQGIGSSSEFINSLTLRDEPEATSKHPTFTEEDRPGRWSGPSDLATYFKETAPERSSLKSGQRRCETPGGERTRVLSEGGRVITPKDTDDSTFPPATKQRASSSLGSRPSLVPRQSVTATGAPSLRRDTAKPPSVEGTPARWSISASGKPPISNSPFKVGSAGIPPLPPPILPPRRQHGGGAADGAGYDDFSLQINGDYDAPFAHQPSEFERPHWIASELTQFERRRQEPHRLTTLPTNPFAPPKMIVMMFRFSNVRNLASTKALQAVGYPELHEQFSTSAKQGTISKTQFLTVVGKYLNTVDRMESVKILDCFDRNALGDVDLNMLLIGLQILLECAAPGDAMRYCFTLMDTANKIPRYITRYEVQTLVAYASAFEADADAQMDAEYLLMARCIQALLSEAQRYDYMGRMPLKEFLVALDQKMRQAQAAEQKQRRRIRGLPLPGTAVAGTVGQPRPEGKSEFMFGKSFTSAALSAVHRMSSKKMIVSAATLPYSPLSSTSVS